MPPRRVHVVKVPTTNRDIFPYSHYRDQGHNPMLDVQFENNQIILVCEDLFKLKPNVMARPSLRADIYIPVQAAMELGADIFSLVGAGHIAELATLDPEDFRVGPQTLPHIDEARVVTYDQTSMTIAGCRIVGQYRNIYLDRERPREGHVEMVEPEIHLGINLNGGRIIGTIEPALTQLHTVPEDELRVGGETNPIRKAIGRLEIRLNIVQAQNFAATLIHYGQ